MPPTLAQEIQKSDAFALPEQEAMLNIVRTAARLEAPFERLLRRHGLSAPLFNVLRIVRGAGPGGAPLGGIGPQMISPAPDVTRLVDRLEALGLATRQRSKADRRVVGVRLAPKGRRLLAKIDPQLEALHARVLGHLSRADLQAINRLMIKARNAPAGD